MDGRVRDYIIVCCMHAFGFDWPSQEIEWGDRNTIREYHASFCSRQLNHAMLRWWETSGYMMACSLRLWSEDGDREGPSVSSRWSRSLALDGRLPWITMPAVLGPCSGGQDDKDRIRNNESERDGERARSGCISIDQNPDMATAARYITRSSFPRRRPLGTPTPLPNS